MNHLLLECNELLKNGGFDYAFCGGYAIELFIDKTVRKHGDIDISAFWDERDKIILFMQSLGWRVYELCGGGKVHYISDVANQIKAKRNIFCMTDDCEIVSLTPTDEPDMFVVDFDLKVQDKLNFIEFLFNNKENNNFLYARNHDVSLPLSQAILCRNGIKYLAPEMVLLYKSTDTEREGYQIDCDMAMSEMSIEQNNWLNNALEVMNPDGHKWTKKNEVMSFDEFLQFRDVKIRNKDHERIVRMFYPYLSSVCGVSEALSEIMGEIIGIDFAGTVIKTGCFNGTSDNGYAPLGIPDFYCTWDNGISVYVYGTMQEKAMINLKENEYVLFALSNEISKNIERTKNRYVYMYEIKLRKYCSDDCAEILDLFYETVHSINSADYSDAGLNAWASKEIDSLAWDKRLSGNYTMVAEKDGIIVGFGSAADMGYFDLLYVHKDYQRMCIATLIANDIEKYLIENSIQPITTDASITAKPFFEKRGYVVQAEQSAPCRGQFLTNYKMQLIGLVEIHPLSEKNLPDYAEVIRQSFATVARDFGWTRENAPGHVSFRTDEQLASKVRDGYYPFGLCIGEKIIGFVSLTDMSGGRYELNKLSILPEFRHFGYGKKLLGFCKEKVKELGGNKITLDIIEENTILKSWYTANGFVHTGTKKFEHLPFTTGYMEWEVNR